MESRKILSYNEAVALDDIWRDILDCEDEEGLLLRIGLRTEDPYVWFDSGEKISLLEIVDEKKWFLAKIKYGI